MERGPRIFLLGALWVLVSMVACVPMPVARLILYKEVVSPAKPNTASVWGNVHSLDWCYAIDPPKIVLLKGPGLPEGGMPSYPRDPASERGEFHYFNLPPGHYTLSLQESVASISSYTCGKIDHRPEVQIEPVEVAIELKEGESREVQLRLVWIKNAPVLTPESGPRYWTSGASSTTTGATIPDYMFQNIPLGPPPDR